jgi:hypothetical protein
VEVVAAAVVELEFESEFEDPEVVAADPLFVSVVVESLEAVVLPVVVVWETVLELLLPVALVDAAVVVWLAAEPDVVVSLTISASNSGNHLGHGHADVRVEKQRKRKVVYSWNDREVLIVFLLTPQSLVFVKVVQLSPTRTQISFPSNIV